MIASDALSAEASRGAAARPILSPLAAQSAAGAIGRALPGGDVFTDDQAPVEWLIDASIVQEAAGGEAP